MKEFGKEFSKEERHEIYKEAREYYKNGNLKFMCQAISNVLYIKYNMRIRYTDKYTDIPSLFKEMLVIKPKKMYGDTVYWPSTNRLIRYKMFKKIINMTI